MLTWHFAHAQLEASTCSTGSVHMLNWKVFMLCSVSVHVLNWHAQAHLKVCACLTESLHMLNWEFAHAQLETCTCAT